MLQVGRGSVDRLAAGCWVCYTSWARVSLGERECRRVLQLVFQACRDLCTVWTIADSLGIGSTVRCADVSSRWILAPDHNPTLVLRTSLRASLCSVGVVSGPDVRDREPSSGLGSRRRIGVRVTTSDPPGRRMGRARATFVNAVPGRSFHERVFNV